MIWRESWRADPQAVPLADRHYNRQKIGARQFVPPGRCVVLRSTQALWVTAWPYAQYVLHAWGGAWVNCLFRNEGREQSSTLIREAVAATLSVWPTPPEKGIVTFIDPKHVKPTKRRGQIMYGFCYLKAGFTHIGFTKGGLWVWQMLPDLMPEPQPMLKRKF